MLYEIDRSKGKAYLQLYTLLREDIVMGAYKYGSKLPSKRLIAVETGLSVITVQHAYDILCDEGYVEARERSGYFVVYKDSDFFTVGGAASKVGEQSTAIPKLKTLELLPDVVNFPFSVFAKTMRRVLSNYGERLLIKSPSCGCTELRTALASYLLRSRGISVKAEQIIIGSGAEYLYSLIVQLLGRDKLFAIEDPSYDTIRKIYEANGVRIEKLRMGADGIETQELQRSKADVLHVTPYNSFPSGITATASKRREYVQWAEKRNAFIIEDDFASEFTVSAKMEDTLFKLQSHDRVIYMNTFTKTIAPSLRIGYMVLPETLLMVFNEYLGFYSCSVPLFEQLVLADFINEGDFERHINRVRRLLRKH